MKATPVLDYKLPESVIKMKARIQNSAVKVTACQGTLKCAEFLYKNSAHFYLLQSNNLVFLKQYKNYFNQDIAS
ncbi:MAG: hypothetical protein Ta2B_04320 [Termitinemataceae bacterium]|nr:MAG: hypothetical protein Ta2B_04320 [Termitinemataceae bacterium]